MKWFAFVFVGMVMILSACAVQEDVLILNDKINVLSRQTGEVYKEISGLQEQVSKMKEGLRSIDTVKSVEVISKKQADMGIQLEDIKMELMRLQDRIERQENRWQELTGRSEAEDKVLAEKMQKLSDQINSLQARIADLEKNVSHEDKTAGKEVKSDTPVADAPGRTVTKQAIAVEKPKIKVRKSAKEDYDEAYKLYKESAYRQAIEKFRTFLKEYPDSDLAGNAGYWLGECYYQQERYEEAILEYEKVVREHKGPKVPAALLKQGLAFHHLGDTKTARFLMEKLLEEYPKSEQAEAARANLKKWGKK
ncbi:MAG: tol-pal system protein YbgF [Deltaproteobacteria bacterium]|nr:tol-pal system protein YbgF [Deltaproteobacteria bacterium]